MTHRRVVVAAHNATGIWALISDREVEVADKRSVEATHGPTGVRAGI